MAKAHRQQVWGEALSRLGSTKVLTTNGEALSRLESTKVLTTNGFET